MNHLRLLLSLLVSLSLTACIQTKTIPSSAQDGTSILLGLGGINRNAQGNQHLSLDDLTITLRDANGTEFTPLKERIFKVYPSYNNRIFSNSSVAKNANIFPYDGGWFVVISLVNDEFGPLGLAPGLAELSIVSSELSNPKPLSQEGDLSQIPLLVLEGTGTYDYTYISQFDYYQASQNSFVIAPDNLGSHTLIGGVNIVINLGENSDTISNSPPIVLPSGHNPFVQLTSRIVENEDGSASLLATVLCPKGFVSADQLGQDNALLSDLSVTLQAFDSNAQTLYTLDTTHSYYIDIDGNKIDNLSPVMTHISEI